MITKKIQWETIEKVWRTELWVGRETPIEPTNGLLLGGGWTKDIMSNPPSFFGVYENDKLLGVNSGHKAELMDDKIYYRSRGIFVFPKARGKGIAQMLLKATENQAKLEKCTHIWSMPRETSLKTYTRFGFEVCGKAEGMEFGPNYYVIKLLT